MKANRKFVNADEAVSPVIAVILMVAITVVLAATVFVLVSDIGSNTSKTQPSVGWAESEVDDQWDINQAPQQVQYQAYGIKIGSTIGDDNVTDNVRVYLDGGSDPNADDDTTAGEDYLFLKTGYQSLPEEFGTMSGGASLAFCYMNAVAAAPISATNVKITLLHTESNSVANEYTFLTIDTDCPLDAV